MIIKRGLKMFPFLLLYKEGFLICGMTNESFSRASEIKSMLSTLNNALSSVARIRIFDNNSCYPGMADMSVYFNELENGAKTTINEKIMDQMRDLEKEFNSL